MDSCKPRIDAPGLSAMYSILSCLSKSTTRSEPYFALMPSSYCDKIVLSLPKAMISSKNLCVFQILRPTNVSKHIENLGNAYLSHHRFNSMPVSPVQKHGIKAVKIGRA